MISSRNDDPKVRSLYEGFCFTMSEMKRLEIQAEFGTLFLILQPRAGQLRSFCSALQSKTNASLFFPDDADSYFTRELRLDTDTLLYRRNHRAGYWRGDDSWTIPRYLIEDSLLAALRPFDKFN